MGIDLTQLIGKSEAECRRVIDGWKMEYPFVCSSIGKDAPGMFFTYERGAFRIKGEPSKVICGCVQTDIGQFGGVGRFRLEIETVKGTYRSRTWEYFARLEYDEDYEDPRNVLPAMSMEVFLEDPYTIFTDSETGLRYKFFDRKIGECSWILRGDMTGFRRTLVACLSRQMVSEFLAPDGVTERTTGGKMVIRYPDGETESVRWSGDGETSVEREAPTAVDIDLFMDSRPRKRGKS